MVTRGLSDLFQSFYSDENFKSYFIQSPDKALASGQYELNSKEIDMAKAFIEKDWSELSVKSPAESSKKNCGNSCSCSCGCGIGCAGCICSDN